MMSEFYVGGRRFESMKGLIDVMKPSRNKSFCRAGMRFLARYGHPAMLPIFRLQWEKFSGHKTKRASHRSFNALMHRIEDNLREKSHS